MTTASNLESLISSVEQSVEAGLAYFEGPGAESKLRIDLWTPREVLVHMVYWHQATVEGMEAVTSGQQPYRIYADTDETNARAVGRASGKSVARLADEARQLQARLSAAARQVPDPDAVIMVRGDGSEASTIQRLERIRAHWDAHIEEIRSQE